MTKSIDAHSEGRTLVAQPDNRRAPAWRTAGGIPRYKAKPTLILNPSQAEAVYSAMCALNNVGIGSGINLSFIGTIDRAAHRITVTETDEDVIRVSVLNHASSAEYHAGQHAFATAYGLNADA